MKGIFKIFREGGIEVWSISNSRFSIFKRNQKEIINFWAEADEISEISKIQRLESGISIEVLTILPKKVEASEFELEIPFIEVPTLGEFDEYLKFLDIWGEDKDLYYNIYSDDHLAPKNCILVVSKSDNQYSITLTGEYDDSSHSGKENTRFEINIVCKLENSHVGYWTKS